MWLLDLVACRWCSTRSIICHPLGTYYNVRISVGVRLDVFDSRCLGTEGECCQSKRLAESRRKVHKDAINNLNNRATQHWLVNEPEL